MKTNLKPITAFSINEVLLVNRVAKMFQFEQENIPSHTCGGFATIKLKSIQSFKKSDLNVLKEQFKKKFDRTLRFEFNKVGTVYCAYLTK